MIALSALLIQLATTPISIVSSPPVRLRGIATVFYAKEPHNNGKLGCVKVARALYGTNEMSDDMPVVAMREGRATCGKLVLIENTKNGRRTWARRLDWGPAGCRHKDGSRTVGKECKSLGGRRPAVIDMSKRVCEAIGCSGKDRVIVRWW